VNGQDKIVGKLPGKFGPVWGDTVCDARRRRSMSSIFLDAGRAVLAATFWRTRVWGEPLYHLKFWEFVYALRPPERNARGWPHHPFNSLVGIRNSEIEIKSSALIPSIVQVCIGLHGEDVGEVDRQPLTLRLPLTLLSAARHRPVT